MHQKAYLLLEDGLFLEGNLIGKAGTTTGEICFNTGMTGYQEIYTDPSYYGQIIINTASHIGNYGTIDEEQESEHPQISGIIINKFSSVASRDNGAVHLQEYLEENNITGIEGVDTRLLVRHVREKGAMNVIISSELPTQDELRAELSKAPSMEGLELSTKVTTKSPYLLGEENDGARVAVLDLGVKKNILRNFTSRNCQVKVFPARTPFSEIEQWEPDGYFLSNGPGDPASMDYAVDTVKEILSSNKPIFGICLGHQILALASGIATYKMHHGHRGINHPVKNLETGLCEITSQNHGFVVSKEVLEAHDNVELTHINLNDNTVAGLRLQDRKAFSVQYHPEASPGPHDSHYLFDNFINLLNP